MNELGVDNYYIELIENCSCNNREELTKREGEIIREYKPDLNKHIAGRTLSEYKEDNREKNLEYDRKRHTLNRDARLQQRKQRYTCCCGSIIRRDGKAEQERTIKHIEFYSNNF